MFIQLYALVYVATAAPVRHIIFTTLVFTISSSKYSGPLLPRLTGGNYLLARSVLVPWAGSTLVVTGAGFALKI